MGNRGFICTNKIIHKSCGLYQKHCKYASLVMEVAWLCGFDTKFGTGKWEFESQSQLLLTKLCYHGQVISPLSRPQFQFSSVTHSCPTLCNPMNHKMPGLAVHHQLPESTQTHAHWVRDAIQPSYPLSSPSPPALNLSQHQGLFKWVSSSHQVAKVFEFQLQHQSFQRTPRTDLL